MSAATYVWCVCVCVCVCVLAESGTAGRGAGERSRTGGSSGWQRRCTHSTREETGRGSQVLASMTLLCPLMTSWSCVRAELVAHYAALGRDAELRRHRAEWREARLRLAGKRRQWLEEEGEKWGREEGERGEGGKREGEGREREKIRPTEYDAVGPPNTKEKKGVPTDLHHTCPPSSPTDAPSPPPISPTDRGLSPPLTDGLSPLQPSTDLPLSPTDRGPPPLPLSPTDRGPPPLPLSSTDCGPVYHAPSLRGRAPHTTIQHLLYPMTSANDATLDGHSTHDPPEPPDPTVTIHSAPSLPYTLAFPQLGNTCIYMYVCTVQ